MRTLGLKFIAATVLMQVLAVGSGEADVYRGGTVGGGPAAIGPDPIFAYTFSIGPDTGSMSLNTVDLGGGLYSATFGSLTVTGSSNSNSAVGNWTLFAGGPSPFLSPSGAFIVDNVLYPASNPTLDVYGLLFTNGSGREVNIWGNSPNNYSFWTWAPSRGYDIQDTYDAAPFSAPRVPEPATLALFGAGLAGLGTLRRRRQPNA